MTMSMIIKPTRGLFIVLLLLSSVFAPAQVRRAERMRPANMPQASTPRVPLREATRETLAATSLNGKPLPYRVLMPADYEQSGRRYPVLYLLHGAGGDENDWSVRTNLTAYVANYNLIVVMPGVGNSWYANSAGDPQARYEDAIIRDLVQHIDALYRTIANWHGRAVAGLSMGGAGAMKFALRYPHLFVFAASFSGAFDASRTNIIGGATDARSQNLLRIFGAHDGDVRKHNDVFLAANNLKEGTRAPYLYVSTGANDPLASVVPSNPHFADVLREHKMQYEYHERPGSHDWRFWDAEIEAALARMSAFLMHMKKEGR